MHRHAAFVAALLLAASACNSDAPPDRSNTPPPSGAITQIPPPTTTVATVSSTGEPSAGPTPTGLSATTIPPPIKPDPGFVLRYATLGPVDMRSNPFAAADTGAFPDEFAAHLYRLLPPAFTLIPELAADDEPPQGESDNGQWVIRVELNEGLTWSDGAPIDAFDVQFTFDDLVRFGDPGNHGWEVQDPRGDADLVSVTAIDRRTVEYRFTSRPTLVRWQFGIATASILPAEYWAFEFSTLADGRESEPDLGLDAPSAGGYRFETVVGGAWRWAAVDGWWNSGAEYAVFDNGAVTYRNARLGIQETYGGTPTGEVRHSWTEGPYAAEVHWQAYNDQPEAIFAITDLREADMVVGGVELGSDFAVGTSAVAVSRTETLVSLVFDPSHPALGTPLLRRAVSCFFLLDFLITNVLQEGVIRSGWVPPEYGVWASDTLDDPCPVAEQSKVDEGIALMLEAGWAWDSPPVNDRDGSIGPGDGLHHRDDLSLVIVIVTPKTSDDPAMASVGLWIEGWLDAIGFDAHVEQGDLADHPDWDIAIVADQVPLPPRPLAGEDIELDLSHLEASTIATAAARWISERARIQADAFAIPLYVPRHVDLSSRRLAFPYPSVVGGYDPAGVATALRTFDN